MPWGLAGIKAASLLYPQLDEVDGKILFVKRLHLSNLPGVPLDDAAASCLGWLLRAQASVASAAGLHFLGRVFYVFTSQPTLHR